MPYKSHRNRALRPVFLGNRIPRSLDALGIKTERLANLVGRGSGIVYEVVRVDHHWFHSKVGLEIVVQDARPLERDLVSEVLIPG